MADDDLVDPTDSGSLFLVEGEVPLARPVMFGDVFTEVPCVRGGDPEPFVMVMTHPCSMRYGPKLRPRVVTGQVLLSPPGRREDLGVWQRSLFDYFPLIGFTAADAAEPYVVRLGELHAAESSHLDVSRRMLALSDYGVAAMLQRWIYQLSRDPVPIAELEELIAPPMAEAELQEEWCETAMNSAGMPLDAASQEFQAFLGEPGDDDLRAWLNSGDISALARVRRAVREELRRRFGS
jgi:hypothetical protein